MEPVRIVILSDSPIATTYRFEKAIRSINFAQTHDLQPIMDALPHLKLREGYILDHYQVGERRNSVCHFYVRKRDAQEKYDPPYRELQDIILARIASKDKPQPEEEIRLDNEYRNPPAYKDDQYIEGTISHYASKTIPSIQDYVSCDFTPIAIWESLLLFEEAIRYLPHVWHGGYARGRLVVNSETLTQCAAVAGREYVKFLDDKRIKPSIEILDESTARVQYCYWNNWRGLTLITTEAIREDKSIRFEDIEEQNLIEYDCGIMF